MNNSRLPAARSNHNSFAVAATEVNFEATPPILLA